nr:uncharacterized protein LOC109147966 [Ipomoea batatas]
MMSIWDARECSRFRRRAAICCLRSSRGGSSRGELSRARLSIYRSGSAPLDGGRIVERPLGVLWSGSGSPLDLRGTAVGLGSRKAGRKFAEMFSDASPLLEPADLVQLCLPGTFLLIPWPLFQPTLSSAGKISPAQHPNIDSPQIQSFGYAYGALCQLEASWNDFTINGKATGMLALRNHSYGFPSFSKTVKIHGRELHSTFPQLTHGLAEIIPSPPYRYRIATCELVSPLEDVEHSLACSTLLQRASDWILSSYYASGNYEAPALKENQHWRQGHVDWCSPPNEGCETQWRMGAMKGTDETSESQEEERENEEALLRGTLNIVGVTASKQVVNSTRMNDQKSIWRLHGFCFDAGIPLKCIGYDARDDQKAPEWVNATRRQAKAISIFIYNNKQRLKSDASYTYGVEFKEWIGDPHIQKETQDPLLRLCRIVASEKRSAMENVYAAVLPSKEIIKERTCRQEWTTQFTEYVLNHRGIYFNRHSSSAARLYLNPSSFIAPRKMDTFKFKVMCMIAIEEIVPDPKIQDRIDERNNFLNKNLLEICAEDAVRA